jgi:hypothetical protein
MTREDAGRARGGFNLIDLCRCTPALVCQRRRRSCLLFVRSDGFACGGASTRSLDQVPRVETRSFVFFRRIFGSPSNSESFTCMPLKRDGTHLYATKKVVRTCLPSS